MNSDENKMHDVGSVMMARQRCDALHVILSLSDVISITIYAGCSAILVFLLFP